MYALIEKITKEQLKKIRLVSGIVFVIFYVVMLYISIGLGGLNMMEYNRVWLTLDPSALADYYQDMMNTGTFFYYRFGHILDLFFAFVYTPFFLSITELSKRGSTPEKKHWKAGKLFALLIIILPFLDWFETGMLLWSVAAYPNIPQGIMYAHVAGKFATAIIYYPLFGWFLYLAIRWVVRKLTKR